MHLSFFQEQLAKSRQVSGLSDVLALVHVSCADCAVGERLTKPKLC